MSSVVKSEDALKVSVNVAEAYQIMDVSNILENTWNPNVVSVENFESLKADIERVGSNKDQPIMVRTHPTEKGKYEIVDGAHRFRAMKELGFEEVIVTVKELSDKEARLKTISMNKFRGDFDSIQLAELLIDLKNNHGVTDEDIKGYLGYTEEEIKGFESLVNFDFDDFEEKVPEETLEDEPMIDEMTLILSPKQRQIIEKLISELGYAPEESLAVAALFFLDNVSSLDSAKLKELRENTSIPPEEQMVPEMQQDIPDDVEF